ncbi:MAG: hypothetical protein WAN16_08635 [Chthoniobacterales bacterium]
MSEILKNILACLGLWFLTSVVFGCLFVGLSFQHRRNLRKPDKDSTAIPK